MSRTPALPLNVARCLLAGGSAAAPCYLPLHTLQDYSAHCHSFSAIPPPPSVPKCLGSNTHCHLPPPPHHPSSLKWDSLSLTFMTYNRQEGSARDWHAGIWTPSVPGWAGLGVSKTRARCCYLTRLDLLSLPAATPLAPPAGAHAYDVGGAFAYRTCLLCWTTVWRDVGGRTCSFIDGERLRRRLLFGCGTAPLNIFCDTCLARCSCLLSLASPTLSLV